MTPQEGWRRLAAALAARPTPPPLLPERPWEGCPPLADACAGAAAGPPTPTPTRNRRRVRVRVRVGVGVGREAALRIAAAVLDDRPEAALAEPASDPEAQVWRAVALRRAGRFPEARRAFRALGARPEHAALFEPALAVLRAPGGGFRWAAEAASHLLVRGTWDPIWFVDACAAVHAGLLSRETAALLEEIQRAELQLMLGAGAVGEA